MAESKNSKGFRIIIAPLDGGDSRTFAVSRFAVRLITAALIFTILTCIAAVFLWGTAVFIVNQNRVVKRELVRVSEQAARVTLIEKNLADMDKTVRYISMALSLTGDSVPPSLADFTANDSLKQQYESSADSLDYANIPNIVPVDGWVSREFDEGEKHFGIDYAASSGTVVRAPARGEVVEVTADPELGNLLVIDHGNGFATRYAHNSRIAVPKGVMVNRGDTIAFVGRSGKAASGPHLHYEIIRDGKAEDPRLYILKGLE